MPATTTSLAQLTELARAAAGLTDELEPYRLEVHA